MREWRQVLIQPRTTNRESLNACLSLLEGTALLADQRERIAKLPTDAHLASLAIEPAGSARPRRGMCDKCGRRGQYWIERLLKQYGPDIAMPDLRHELAQCPHRLDMSNPCQVNYLD